MIEVKVGGMVVDKKSGSPVLLLKVPNTQHYLPIWIGPSEATAIDMVLRKRNFERPLTHDLLKQIVDGLGGTVSRVIITALKDNTFFAKIFITRGHEIIAIDARPSDSVALALRARCPIYLSKELLASQQISLLQLDHDLLGGDEAAAGGIDKMLKQIESKSADAPTGDLTALLGGDAPEGGAENDPSVPDPPGPAAPGGPVVPDPPDEQDDEEQP
jgi:bifunctional DNase/RNase